MESAILLKQPRPATSPASAPAPSTQPDRLFSESGREIQPWEIKAGKTIFYLTVALSLWFFYWLNGIQCPC